MRDRGVRPGAHGVERLHRKVVSTVCRERQRVPHRLFLPARATVALQDEVTVDQAGEAGRRARRQAPGGTPTCFLNARLNDASDS